MIDSAFGADLEAVAGDAGDGGRGGNGTDGGEGGDAFTAVVFNTSAKEGGDAAAGIVNDGDRDFGGSAPSGADGLALPGLPFIVDGDAGAGGGLFLGASAPETADAVVFVRAEGEAVEEGGEIVFRIGRSFGPLNFAISVDYEIDISAAGLDAGDFAPGAPLSGTVELTPSAAVRLATLADGERKPPRRSRSPFSVFATGSPGAWPRSGPASRRRASRRPTPASSRTGAAMETTSGRTGATTGMTPGRAAAAPMRCAAGRGRTASPVSPAPTRSRAAAGATASSSTKATGSTGSRIFATARTRSFSPAAGRTASPNSA